jgi:protein-ribulosamine 3-kinase
MNSPHQLLEPGITAAVERTASEHLGRPWASAGFSDLNDRASHQCGIYHGTPFSVFAKLGAAGDADGQFAAELAGLRFMTERAGIATPVPVASGVVRLETSALLLFEALPERSGSARHAADYAAFGRTLATLHQVHSAEYGLAEFDGYFGPLPQHNRPLPAATWADFYAEHRVLPLLRLAVDSGSLPADLAAQVEHLTARLPALCAPEPRPSLLHGDAQQNNFLATPSAVVLIDACPYFGHPEVDLALVDYFEPVPPQTFQAYHAVVPLDSGFDGRRELWRLFAYLAVIAVDGPGSFGRQFLRRLAAAARIYR